MCKEDKEFVVYMLEIDKRYSNFRKPQQIKIEQWSKKLCQAAPNIPWKLNRNRYALLLLDQILNNELKPPFSSIPPYQELPMIQKYNFVDYLLRIGVEIVPKVSRIS